MTKERSLLARVACSWFPLALFWAVGCNSGQKSLECQALVGPLGMLGERLEEVRYVVSGTEVKPREVSEVLRPFSATAQKVAKDLGATNPSVKAIQDITKSAQSAAVALSKQAIQMAELAESMTDVEAPSKIVDERKQRVDNLELQIKEICVSTPEKCTNISGILARFPAPTDQSEVASDAQVWTKKLKVWADELSKAEVKDTELKTLVASFVNDWLELAKAMSQLVAALETSKKYEALSHDFNQQITLANQAVSNANTQCAAKK